MGGSVAARAAALVRRPSRCPDRVWAGRDVASAHRAGHVTLDDHALGGLEALAPHSPRRRFEFRMRDHAAVGGDHAERRSGARRRTLRTWSAGLPVAEVGPLLSEPDSGAGVLAPPARPGTGLTGCRTGRRAGLLHMHLRLAAAGPADARVVFRGHCRVGRQRRVRHRAGRRRGQGRACLLLASAVRGTARLPPIPAPLRPPGTPVPALTTRHNAEGVMTQPEKRTPKGPQRRPWPGGQPAGPRVIDHNADV
jgi:hypothetical protein